MMTKKTVFLAAAGTAIGAALLLGCASTGTNRVSDGAEYGRYAAHSYKEVDVAGVKNFNGNYWGLVYDGAITENKAGEVNIHPVNYELDGITIAANVYTPADWKKDGSVKFPAVTVAHPNGGVKEQVAGLFAQKLAENGYIAVAADARTRAQAEDFHAILTFHRTASMMSVVWWILSPAMRVWTLSVSGHWEYVAEAATLLRQFSPTNE